MLSDEQQFLTDLLIAAYFLNLFQVRRLTSSCWKHRMYVVSATLHFTIHHYDNVRAISDKKRFSAVLIAARMRRRSIMHGCMHY